MTRLTRREILAASAAAVLTDNLRAQALNNSQAPQQDLILWYDNPAKHWADALPVGNGRLGAMVYGGGADGSPQSDVLQINEDTLWSGKPHDGNNPKAKQYLPAIRSAVLEGQDYHEADRLCREMQGAFAEAYQPLANIRLRFTHSNKITNYRRRLDLDTASAQTSYEVDGIRFERTTFVSAPDQVIVYRVTATQPGQLQCSLSIDSPLQKQVSAIGQDRLVLVGKAPSHVAGAGHARTQLPVTYSDETGSGMFFSAVLRVQAEGGELECSAQQLSVAGANSLTIMVTAGTGFRGFSTAPDVGSPEIVNNAIRQMDSAAKRSYSEIQRRQQADHQLLFRRVSLRLGPSSSVPNTTTEARLARVGNALDPSLLALYFQYGRYLLICSSRPGTQAANLQGIWNDKVLAPWSSNYTANINVQMNYWPAEVCNLSECAEPLFNLISQLRETGRRAAQETYGLDGWCSHHNIDIWCAANPVGEGVGQPTWANWNMSGPWLCQHLYDHFLFTGDIEFLRARAYPIMRGAAEFCLAWLIEDGRGRLTTCPSESTENDFMAADGKPANTSAGCTMDMTLIRELFANCIAAAAELRMDHEFTARLRSASRRLIPFQIGRHGQLQEWSIDFPESTPGQRHMSHLYGLYPGDQITPLNTPQLARAARVSLERRLASGGAYTGWSRAWEICFWARLGDGDQAGEALSMLIQHSTNLNLFDTHPAPDGPIFQIDGNFGATAGIAEMLIQSHTGELALLPAIPSAWSEGEAKGLRARGGLTVDISWSAAQLTSCRLHAQQTRQISIRLPRGQSVLEMSRADGAKAAIENGATGAVKLRLEAGNTYQLRLASSTS